MGLLNNDSDEAPNVNHPGIKQAAYVINELLAGGAAFAAAKAFDEYQAQHGKPLSLARAMEICSAFAAAFIDREVETKSLDSLDREKIDHDAKEHLEKEFYKMYN